MGLKFPFSHNESKMFALIKWFSKLFTQIRKILISKTIRDLMKYMHQGPSRKMLSLIPLGR